MTDNINHPSHYTWFSNGSEVIDITENLSFNLGNVVKYVARAGRKASSSQLEDLSKAQWYLSRELDRLAPPQRLLLGQPRVWDRFRDIPEGVAQVTDKEGDYYTFKDLSWTWEGTGEPVEDLAYWTRQYGPFTEVMT